MVEPCPLHVRLQQTGPIPLAVEFSCSDGELLALIGPSGSGKTTILRAIAGLYQPAKGLVTSRDAVWLDTSRGISLAPHQRRIGLVFQNYALFPHMTAVDNVATALGHCPSHERLNRARGGQQQRVAVARALARDPVVLLLDEPFSAVDRRTRRKLHAELAELRRSVRIPIVLVTHDVDEAAGLADRLCVIDQGETLQIGTPTDLLAAPAGSRVAAALDLSTA